jgi:hypothetical protein
LPGAVHKKGNGKLLIQEGNAENISELRLNLSAGIQSNQSYEENKNIHSSKVEEYDKKVPYMTDEIA